LEWSHTIAANVAGGLLGDLGAQVLMVEPEAGCAQRAHPGFHVWSRAKQSIVGDPSRLAALAMAADVVIADEQEWLEAGCPRAALATVIIVPDHLQTRQLGGLTGEVAASFAEAYSGLAYQQHALRSGPSFLVDGPASFACGALAAGAALVCAYALAPQQVTVSHLDGAVGLQLLSSVLSADATVPEREREDDPFCVGGPVGRFCRAQDGWFYLAVPTPARWVTLMLLLGLDDVLADPRFEGAPFAVESIEARMTLADRVQGAVAQRTVSSWLQLLRDADVIASPVLSPREALVDPHVIAVGLREEVDDHRVAARPGAPIVVDGERYSEFGSVPGVGEHSLALLRAFDHPWQSSSSVAAEPVGGPPLEGLKVLDLSTFAAGPGQTRLLGALGADVIKLEQSDGDAWRGVFYSYLGANAGKRIARCDLKTDSGRHSLQQLISDADVIVHNLRQQQAQRLGLGVDEVAELNPRAVQCVVSGFGTSGPDALLGAVDAAAESRSGGALLQGGGQRPMGYDGGATDNGTSLMGFVATMAALCARQRGPDSCRQVEVTLLATSMYRHAGALVEGATDFESTLGEDPLGPHASFRFYRAGDGDWFLLGVTTEMQWGALRQLISGLPGRFQPSDATWNDVTAAIITEAATAQSAADWEAACGTAGVPLVRALRYTEFVRASEESEDAMTFPTFNVAGWGDLRAPTRLFRFERHRWLDPKPFIDGEPSDLTWRGTPSR
jgi:crotonobetainyl-CoA:carnitine CoA-transferase CaiB-like acyl-CoA transferase